MCIFFSSFHTHTHTHTHTRTHTHTHTHTHTRLVVQVEYVMGVGTSRQRQLVQTPKASTSCKHRTRMRTHPHHQLTHANTPTPPTLQNHDADQLVHGLSHMGWLSEEYLVGHGKYDRRSNLIWSCVRYHLYPCPRPHPTTHHDHVHHPTHKYGDYTDINTHTYPHTVSVPAQLRSIYVKCFLHALAHKRGMHRYGLQPHPYFVRLLLG